jgi:hypothetical protein
MPDFTLPTYQGGTLSLSTLRGKNEYPAEPEKPHEKGKMRMESPGADQRTPRLARRHWAEVRISRVRSL